jgi:transcriptional regulator with XRE-family HTH domain
LGQSSPAVAEAFADIVREVRDASSLTVAEIATIAGVQERQVRHWASGTHRPHGAGRDALLELHYVIKLLRDVYRPEGVEIWLHSRNPELSGERPIDLLRNQQFIPVLQAIERLRSGAM